MSKILVTGGAGFIGSHLVDALIDEGHDVTVVDSLEPQVHGDSGDPPDYLNPKARFVKGDVRDRVLMEKLIRDAEILFHKAAAVGVGQSMYQVEKYVDMNSRGASVILDVVASRNHNLKKMIVASSMSIYGEGAYRCPSCGPVYPHLREDEQLQKRQWEHLCPTCGAALEMAPTDENKPLYPTSVYAITKRDHEELFLTVGHAYQVPTVALRYFNVYGPRQALSNPYTGVAAIFSSRLLSGQPPLIFEDGKQSRDFIHVNDIVRANLCVLRTDRADYKSVNIGTGRATSVLQVAETLARLMGNNIEPKIVGKFREGDIRHCVADVSRAKELLGFEAQVTFEEGMKELVGWVRNQTCEDRVTQMAKELEERGLTR